MELLEQKKTAHAQEQAPKDDLLDHRRHKSQQSSQNRAGDADGSGERMKNWDREMRRRGIVALHDSGYVLLRHQSNGKGEILKN